MMCAGCRLLNHDLRVILKQAVEASPKHKEKQTEPSSNIPLKYLSPCSQASRLKKSTTERKRLRKSLFKAESAMDVILLDEQESEMTEVVRAIEERGDTELSTIIEEAELIQEGNGEMLRDVWEQDVASRSKFYEDQLKNSML